MDELESDGIIRDLFDVDGRRLASFQRGEALRFIRKNAGTSRVRRLPPPA